MKSELNSNAHQKVIVQVQGWHSVNEKRELFAYILTEQWHWHWTQEDSQPAYKILHYSNLQRFLWSLAVSTEMLQPKLTEGASVSVTCWAIQTSSYVLRRHMILEIWLLHAQPGDAAARRHHPRCIPVLLFYTQKNNKKLSYCWQTTQWQLVVLYDNTASSYYA